MSVSYVFSPLSSWAIQSLGLNGPAVAARQTRVAGAFPGTSVTTARIDTGTVVGGEGNALDGGTAATGDVLLAAVSCLATGGQVITPPAGWTTLIPLVGVGTKNVLLSVFWKVAAAGDITGSLTFNAVNSDDLIAFVVALNQTTIDTSTPVLATTSAVGASDATTASCPDPAVTAPATIAGFIGLAGSTSPAAVTTGSAGGFGSLNGGGSGTPDNFFLYGFRYYLEVTHRGWVQGADRW